MRVTLLALALLLSLLLATGCPGTRGSGDDDGPPFDPSTLPAGPTPPHAAMEAEVLEIIDGDTGRFRLSDGDVRSVRFLSIDTTEMNAGNSKPPECYAQEATDRTQALLPVGTSVWLTWDGEYQDVYNRLLCYIFVGEPSEPEDAWVNLTLVREGYARAFIFDNNQTWRDTFEDAEQAARDADLGRWGACGF